MRKPRRPFSQYKAAALLAYRRRNAVLKGLGFDSYVEYLASPLWAEIRERKLDSEGRRCFACGKPATQVHHGNYEEETLTGPSQDAATYLGVTIGPAAWEAWLRHAELYAVCKVDHEWSEHFAGEKLPPEIATKRLKNRRRKNRLDETVPRAARQGRQELRAREMDADLKRLIERDEE